MKDIFKNKFFAAGMIVIILIAVAFIAVLNYPKQTKIPSQPSETSKEQNTVQPQPPKPIFMQPLTDAQSRITKKPFGIYITPQTSPVQPEKFAGYHTGTDFETTSVEAGIDVSVYAVCTGKIRVKEIVQGYGGVIVQDCTIKNQPVTVLYGHINIRQSQVSLGLEVKASDKVAILAPANSEYSSGERKHLHLGIHKGTAIDYRGYVQNQSELSGWLDAVKYL
ncbi:MAG: M23 family metallopeptidase [bacterium]|nr:M23 family metallopeptidase [bacterium]